MSEEQGNGKAQRRAQMEHRSALTGKRRLYPLARKTSEKRQALRDKPKQRRRLTKYGVLKGNRIDVAAIKTRFPDGTES